MKDNIFPNLQKKKRIIPNFLIEKTQNPEDLKTLLNGLKLVTDYLEKSILKPNNLIQPISRLQFINTLKNQINIIKSISIITNNSISTCSFK